MISQSERYFYICESKISTFRGYFDPPTIKELIESLQNHVLAGLVTAVSYGNKSVSLSDLVVDGGVAAFLFRITDPDIPDSILENSLLRTLREAKREKGEVPALSAHLVINMSKQYDVSHAYPSAIENIDRFPRSTIENYLLRVFGDLFGENRFHPKHGEDREYRPRVAFAGHPSKTIERVLNGGGKLHGMHFESVTVKDDGFGEDAYAVTKTEEIHLKVSGKPQGASAVKWIRDKFSKYKLSDNSKIRVVMEDESGRVKTSRVDNRIIDVASNYFILQERLKDFDTPLAACESSVRMDIVKKVQNILPV